MAASAPRAGCCSRLARVLSAPLQDVQGQVFNVGSSDQNYQIVRLGEIVTELFPQTEMVIENEVTDPRDYNVSFDKISSVLGFRAQESVAGAAQEIWTDLDLGRICDPEGGPYYNYRVDYFETVEPPALRTYLGA